MGQDSFESNLFEKGNNQMGSNNLLSRRGIPHHLTPSFSATGNLGRLQGLVDHIQCTSLPARRTMWRTVCLNFQFGGRTGLREATIDAR